MNENWIFTVNSAFFCYFYASFYRKFVEFFLWKWFYNEIPIKRIWLIKLIANILENGIEWNAFLGCENDEMLLSLLLFSFNEWFLYAAIVKEMKKRIQNYGNFIILAENIWFFFFLSLSSLKLNCTVRYFNGIILMVPSNFGAVQLDSKQ